MDCRKTICSLEDTEQASFITGVNTFKASGRYDDFLCHYQSAMDESTLLPGEFDTTYSFRLWLEGWLPEPTEMASHHSRTHVWAWTILPLLILISLRIIARS